MDTKAELFDGGQENAACSRNDPPILVLPVCSAQTWLLVNAAWCFVLHLAWEQLQASCVYCSSAVQGVHIDFNTPAVCLCPSKDNLLSHGTCLPVQTGT